MTALVIGLIVLAVALWGVSIWCTKKGRKSLSFVCTALGIACCIGGALIDGRRINRELAAKRTESAEWIRDVLVKRIESPTVTPIDTDGDGRPDTVAITLRVDGKTHSYRAVPGLKKGEFLLEEQK